MDLRETASMTWSHLSSHKLRVALTVVGILVGVASVVAVVTMGESVKATVSDQFGVFDANMAVTCLGEKRRDQAFCDLQSSVFTDYDVDNVRQLEHVQAAAPLGRIPTAMLVHGTETKSYGMLIASGREIFPTVGAEIEQGRMYRNGEMELVIGSAIVDYFGEDDPVRVGDTLIVVYRNGLPMRATVVGILAPTQIGQFYYGYDQSIYSPIDPFYNERTVSPQTGLPMNVYPEILVRAPDEQSVDETQVEVLDYLRSDDSDAKRLKPANKDFVVLTAQFFLDLINQQIGTFTTFIVAIAGISLVSGGIGIMNIMLVGAVERTREIGIMKAVGAKKRDILELFGFESALLGVLGGLAGVVVGVLGSIVLVDYIRGATPYDVLFVVPWLWLPIAVGVGLGVGVLAGLYPAWRAATVDPVEALRYE